MVFEDGEGDVPVFVGEFIFHEDFVEEAGYLGWGIAEGAASEGSEHPRVVAVSQAYAQDGPDFMSDGLDQVVHDHPVGLQIRSVHAGYGYEIQLAGLFLQAESIAFILPEYGDRGGVDASEVPVHRVLEI